MPAVRIALADDHPMHRGMLKVALSALSKTPMSLEVQIVKEANDGKEMVDWLSTQPTSALPHLVTLDIRMPNMDGLTALYLIRRRLTLNIPILMVSSEDQGTVDRYLTESAPPQVKAMSNADKMANLAKVEARVMSGTIEPGKVNDLLSGCEKLCMDPVAYAMKLGANGFLKKPYTPDQVVAVAPEVINGKTINP